MLGISVGRPHAVFSVGYFGAPPEYRIILVPGPKINFSTTSMFSMS